MLQKEQPATREPVTRRECDLCFDEQPTNQTGENFQ